MSRWLAMTPARSWWLRWSAVVGARRAGIVGARVDRRCGAVRLVRRVALARGGGSGVPGRLAAAHRRRLGQRRAGRRAAGTERRDGLATQQVVARCRPVRMPGRVARSAAGASGTLEHEHCDEAVGGARPAIGTGGMLGSAGLRRGQSLEMRPCFV